MLCGSFDLSIFLCLFASSSTYPSIVRVKRQSIDENSVEESRPFYSLNPSFLYPADMLRASSDNHQRGSDVMLRCAASGAAPIAYSWTMNGEPLKRRHRIKFAKKRSTLKIKRIRETDLGAFTCTASNRYGNLSFSFHLKLSDKSALPEFYDPEMMNRRRVSLRPTSDSIRFQCRAHSSSPLSYTWFKDGHLLTSVHGGGSTHKSDLDLERLRARDGGLYRCVVANEHGNTSFSYELRIVLRRSGGNPPKVIPFSSTHQSVQALADVNLDCLEILSATIPHVRWFHLRPNTNAGAMPRIPSATDWTDLAALPFHAEHVSPMRYQTFNVFERDSNELASARYVYDDTDPYGMRLLLRNVTAVDAGVYACVVSNSEGIDWTSFEVRVRGSDDN